MPTDKKDIEIDIVSEVLNAMLQARPDSDFIKSLNQQYRERGGLSKKQLEGLYLKAAKVTSIPAKKLATLQAHIMKRPTRYKSALPPVKPLYEKNEQAGKMIEAILQKYPEHKRVLFYKNKYDRNEIFSPAETSELERFYKLLKISGV
ncbi:hypothetical protein [Foetidibacter luteolus]|uniref:hypothetical protein n=1 Tax=Foetidibacter luteolus TaxID=2608880 RepID=UPI00129A5143|nr:hypothetical protein [Foetidibacter luteolus]